MNTCSGFDSSLSVQFAKSRNLFYLLAEAHGLVSTCSELAGVRTQKRDSSNVI